jgi:hypothetical protein
MLIWKIWAGERFSGVAPAAAAAAGGPAAGGRACERWLWWAWRCRGRRGAGLPGRCAGWRAARPRCGGRAPASAHTRAKGGTLRPSSERCRCSRSSRVRAAWPRCCTSARCACSSVSCAISSSVCGTSDVRGSPAATLRRQASGEGGGQGVGAPSRAVPQAGRRSARGGARASSTSGPTSRARRGAARRHASFWRTWPAPRFATTARAPAGRAAAGRQSRGAPASCSSARLGVWARRRMASSRAAGRRCTRALAMARRRSHGPIAGTSRSLRRGELREELCDCVRLLPADALLPAARASAGPPR